MNSHSNEQDLDFYTEENLPPQPLSGGAEDPDLNILFRLRRMETITKLGVYGTILIGISAFCIEWINYRWWLIWPVVLFSLRNLQRQRISLSQEKPFEARVANIFFLLLIFIMIVRDVFLTISVNQISR